MIVMHRDQDITEYVSSISWGGSRTEVARKLELKVVNAPLDKNIKPLNIKLADPIYFFEDDGKTELFRGFVTDREASSTTGTVTYTAYDLLYYTLKSKATYNFSSKTAEAITKMVCNDMEIPIGSIASTGLSQKLIVQNVSIYEIIMQAYTQAHEQNDKNYYVTAKNGLLNVEEMGKTVREIDLTEDTNIISSKYKESLSNMVNKVRIYDEEGNPAGVVENKSDIQNYGIFQQVYTKEEGKDATTTAKSMFNGVEKTFDLQCTNYNEIVTGVGVIIKDSSTGLSGIVWVDADTHTWSNGVAVMNLTVTLKQIMDTKTVDEQDTSTDTSDSDDSSTSSTSTSISTKNTNTSNRVYGSKANPPFRIVTRSYVDVGEGSYETYAGAYLYYLTHGGTGEGWKLLDKDGREVLV